MKIRALVLGCLAGAIILSIAHEGSRAEQRAEGLSSRIGVISLRQIWRDSKKNIAYRTEVIAEQSRVRAELEDLSREIEAEDAELKTLRPGTTDHLEQVKALLEKRAALDAKQEYLKQQRTLRDKHWTEGLYKEVLETVKALAEEKGLELVFERTEPDFPITAEELMMTLNTHKLLYSGRCVDITNEVIARLDKEEKKSDNQ